MAIVCNSDVIKGQNKPAILEFSYHSLCKKFVFVSRNSMAADAKPMVCVEAIFGHVRKHPENRNFRS